MTSLLTLIKQSDRPLAFKYWIGYCTTIFPLNRVQIEILYKLESSAINCLVMARGGGKTQLFCIYLVFCCIRGERWGYMPAHGDQLSEFRLKCQAFTFHCKVTQYYVEIGQNRIVLAMLMGKSRRRSRRLTGIAFDECGEIATDSEKEAYFGALGQLSGYDKPKTIYAGTLKMGSLLQEIYHKQRTIILPYDKLPWTQAAYELAKSDGMPEWSLKLEYLCEEAFPSGLVLPDVQWVSKAEMLKYKPNRAGIDINAGFESVALGYRWEQSFFITGEMAGDFIHNPGGYNQLKGLGVEVESNYTRGQNIDKQITAAVGGLTQWWDAEAKYLCLTRARQLNIVCCKELTPRIAKDLETTVYFEKTGLWLKDEAKGRPCHWFDALMHAINANQNKTWGGGKTAITYI